MAVIVGGNFQNTTELAEWRVETWGTGQKGPVGGEGVERESFQLRAETAGIGLLGGLRSHASPFRIPQVGVGLEKHTVFRNVQAVLEFSDKSEQGLVLGFAEWLAVEVADKADTDRVLIRGR